MDYLSEIIKAAIRGDTPPKKPIWHKWLHRALSDRHCAACLSLDQCWFEKENSPRWPQHPFCHCIFKEISYTDVLTKSSADSAFSKFDPYLFDTKGEYGHNKDKLFKSWGYTAEDSAYLKSEIEKQGLEKYIAGEYTLGKLNAHGQRISIVIQLRRKNSSAIVTFVSGWMVYPNGHIELTTPYGGK